MNILHWIKLLSDLSENDKDNLSLFCQEKSLKKWEILFKEGDEANAMYILKSWTFEIRKKIKILIILAINYFIYYLINWTN